MNPVSAIAPWLECTKAPNGKAERTYAEKIIHCLGGLIHKLFLSQSSSGGVLSSGAYNFAKVFEEEQQEIANQCDARHVAVDLKFDGQPGTPVPDRLGIAFSGGGIRSACVAIGVMQRLAQAGILKQVHYLSAISGGTYAMSWLTAWTKRLGDFSVVQGCLGNNTNNGLPAEPAEPPQYRRFLEPDPLHYLRRYSSYLTPRMGLFNGDTFAAVSIYLRNLLLNQVMLVAALASVTVVLQQITPTIGSATALDTRWLVIGVPMTVVLFGVAAVLVWRALARLPESRTPGKKYPAYVAMACAWGIACLIWLITPRWYVTHPADSATDWIVLGLGVLGFVVSSVFGERTMNSSVEKGKGLARWFSLSPGPAPEGRFAWSIWPFAHG